MMISLNIRSLILFMVPLTLYGADIAGAANFCSWYTKKVECLNHEFRCFNGEKCISRELYCNGADNCGDNSDEAYCRVRSCPQKLRSCYSYSSPMKCIPPEWFCNRFTDCSGGRDEDGCGTARPRIDTSGSTLYNRTALDNVRQWINNQKKEQNSAEKWGHNVDKLAISLYLADDDPALKRLLPNKDSMAYELSIQLLSQLARFIIPPKYRLTKISGTSDFPSNINIENIPSTELASYVNAFLVTCVNPRKFHGHNIIKELRNRADQRNYTNPYVFLALCNAGETITDSDKNKLIDIFENKQRTFWTDMQAVVVMTLACANKQPGNEVDYDTLRDMTLELKQQQFRNGTVVNMPTTALVLQALIAVSSESDPDTFDEVKAFQELLRNQKSDGSFGDMMNTFLAAPVLTCKSLVDINSTHCQYGSTDEKSALENLSRSKGPKIRVQYSLWIGIDKDFERNLVLRVPQNLSLYSIMEIAAELDSRFKFEYLVKDRKPYINAIYGMRDNPLTGKFWFLYSIQNGKPTLSNESPANIVPRDNDHYVMWYRRGIWVK